MKVMTNSLSYQRIYDSALMRFGGDKQRLEASLPKPLPVEQLLDTPDSVFLSMMTRRVFQAGMKHSVINDRWPYFEQVFDGFDVYHCAMLSPDDIERLMQDSGLIRHRRKLASIPQNAAMMLAWRKDYDTAAQFLTSYPKHRVVELWIYLKRHGASLGGNSGARFLRMAGVDTFLLTDDNIAALELHGLVTKAPSSQADWRRVQKLFSDWASESGRSLAEVSRLLSYGIYE